MNRLINSYRRRLLFVWEAYSRFLRQDAGFFRTKHGNRRANNRWANKHGSKRKWFAWDGDKGIARDRTGTRWTFNASNSAMFDVCERKKLKVAIGDEILVRSGGQGVTNKCQGSTTMRVIPGFDRESVRLKHCLLSWRP